MIAGGMVGGMGYRIVFSSDVKGRLDSVVAVGGPISDGELGKNERP